MSEFLGLPGLIIPPSDRICEPDCRWQTAAPSRRCEIGERVLGVRVEIQMRIPGEEG